MGRLPPEVDKREASLRSYERPEVSDRKKWSNIRQATHLRRPQKQADEQTFQSLKIVSPNKWHRSTLYKYNYWIVLRFDRHAKLITLAAVA